MTDPQRRIPLAEAVKALRERSPVFQKDEPPPPPPPAPKPPSLHAAPSLAPELEDEPYEDGDEDDSEPLRVPPPPPMPGTRPAAVSTTYARPEANSFADLVRRRESSIPPAEPLEPVVHRGRRRGSALVRPIRECTARARVTADELHRWEQEALRRGLTVSDLIRTSVLYCIEHNIWGAR